jgi:hypothetical protein
MNLEVKEAKKIEDHYKKSVKELEERFLLRPCGSPAHLGPHEQYLIRNIIASKSYEDLYAWWYRAIMILLKKHNMNLYVLLSSLKEEKMLRLGRNGIAYDPYDHWSNDAVKRARKYFISREKSI